jgi:hypothetical protein
VRQEVALLALEKYALGTPAPQVVLQRQTKVPPVPTAAVTEARQQKVGTMYSTPTFAH